MSIHFVNSIPKRHGDLKINVEFAETLIEQLASRPGEWAQIAFLDLYPGYEGRDEESINKAGLNLASRIRRNVRPFHEYEFEVKTRQKGTVFFIRIKADVEYVEES